MALEKVKEAGLIALGHLRTGPIRALVWAQLAAQSSNLYYAHILPPRDSLPDPIDISDHLGNVPDSVFWTGLGAIVTCSFIPLKASKNTVRFIGYGAAFGLAVVANAISETKTGQRLFDIAAMGPQDVEHYVPNQDVVDFVWGTVAGTGAGMLVVKAAVHEPVQELLEQRQWEREWEMEYARPRSRGI